ncbi:hypothetical protein ACLOJK_022010 [Asimina triloba]
MRQCCHAEDSPPNFRSLRRGFDVIDAAKAALEFACPNTASFADIIAFAARDSAILAGNISYQVFATAASENLPPPTFNATQLLASFAPKNLYADDLVLLSGAQSFGISRCASFTNRLYNTSSGAALDDPTLSSAYAGLLRCPCPANCTSNETTVVAFDIITPETLDNHQHPSGSDAGEGGVARGPGERVSGEPERLGGQVRRSDVEDGVYRSFVGQRRRDQDELQDDEQRQYFYRFCHA